MNNELKIAPTEHQIQDGIIGYLRVKGYYVQRLNAGQYAVGEGRQRRHVIGVAAGTPDILAFKQETEKFRVDNIEAISQVVRLLFIEVKRPGKKPTALQKAKMEELTEHGAECVVATSIADLEKAGI